MCTHKRLGEAGNLLRVLSEAINSLNFAERRMFVFFPELRFGSGDLAQLARASALQAEGQGFKSPNLQ